MTELTIFPTGFVNVRNSITNMTYSHIEVIMLPDQKIYPSTVGKLQISLQVAHRDFLELVAKLGTYLSRTNDKRFKAYLLPVGDLGNGTIVISPDCHFECDISEAYSLLTKQDAEFTYTPLSPTKYELMFTLHQGANSDKREIRLLIPIVNNAPVNINETLREAAQTLLDMDFDNKYNNESVSVKSFLSK